MDTSETYIKMTLALPESMLEKMDEMGCRWFYVSEPDRTVRLFEQDQLQEMVDWEDNRPIAMINELYKSIHRPISRKIEPPLRTSDGLPKYSILGSHMEYWYPFELFTSMEQLWLAFVMEKNFNKYWDGEKWGKD